MSRRFFWVLAPAIFACHGHGSSSSGVTPAPSAITTRVEASTASEVDLHTWPDVTGPGTDIGSGEPTLDAMGDSKRRWALVCQGPNDASSTWRFVLGAGKGRELDAVLAVAPKGDFLVVVVDGSTVLVDAARAVATTIAAEPSVAGFSKDGTKLVYTDGRDLVRFDLASRASNRVALPSGEPYLVDVDTSGAWAMVSVGRTAGENWYGPPDALACARPDPYVLNFVRPGVPVWVDLASGRQIVDKQVVRVAGGHTYRVEDDKLTIDGNAAGPKDCDGRATLSSGPVVADGLEVIGVVESPPRALVVCARTKGARTVELAGPDKVLGTSKASLMMNGVNDVAPMMTPPAGRICASFDAIVPTCLDATTGAKSKGKIAPAEAFGMHDGWWWYAGSDDDQILAGPEHHGPLRWIPRPK